MDLTGAQRRPIPSLWLKLVQLVSGYLVLRWLVWLAAHFLFGYRVESTLTVDERGLTYRAQTHLLGRTVRNVEEVFLNKELVSISVEKRFPHLLLLLGALGLLAGCFYGMTAVIDGIQASYLAISLVGIAIIAAGILLDLMLGSIAGYLGEKHSVLVSVASGSRGLWGRRFRVHGVDESRAHAFVTALSGSAT